MISGFLDSMWADDDYLIMYLFLSENDFSPANWRGVTLANKLSLVLVNGLMQMMRISISCMCNQTSTTWRFPPVRLFSTLLGSAGFQTLE